MIALERKLGESGRDYAFRAIAENIVSTIFEPGSWIKEQDVADMLNISRTPVREAFKELAYSEIVTIYPKRGIYVNRIDQEFISELQLLRESMDRYVIVGACEKITNQELQQLEENIALQKYYLSVGNLNVLTKYRMEFLYALYRISGKRATQIIMKLCENHISRVMSLATQKPDNEKIVGLYHDLWQALAIRDKDCSLKIMRSLMSDFQGYVAIVAEKYPQYMEDSSQ